MFLNSFLIGKTLATFVLLNSNVLIISVSNDFIRKANAVCMV